MEWIASPSLLLPLDPKASLAQWFLAIEKPIFLPEQSIAIQAQKWTIATTIAIATVWVVGATVDPDSGRVWGGRGRRRRSDAVNRGRVKGVLGAPVLQEEPVHPHPESAENANANQPPRNQGRKLSQLLIQRFWRAAPTIKFQHRQWREHPESEQLVLGGSDQQRVIPVPERTNHPTRRQTLPPGTRTSDYATATTTSTLFLCVPLQRCRETVQEQTWGCFDAGVQVESARTVQTPSWNRASLASGSQNQLAQRPFACQTLWPHHLRACTTGRYRAGNPRAQDRLAGLEDPPTPEWTMINPTTLITNFYNALNHPRTI